MSETALAASTAGPTRPHWGRLGPTPPAPGWPTLCAPGGMVEPRSIVIVGGGLVGQTLAAKLSGDGHDVTLIESDSAKAQELSETLDIQIVEGNGATASVLR